MPNRRQRAAIAATAAGTALVALTFPTRAADGGRPRTPPVFDGGACIEDFDRSADPVFHLAWSVEQDDLPPDAADPLFNEVPDGRRFQFLAFSQEAPEYPAWITTADVEAAATAIDGFEESFVSPEDILEGGPAIDPSTWLRISADDARIPITAEAAEPGLDWDTSSVAAGTWLIMGYTWDPEFNLWTRHPSLLRVHDGDAANAAPAAVVPIEEGTLVTEAEPVTFEGCLRAPAGTTVDVDWAEVVFVGEPEWMPIDDGVTVDAADERFSFAFAPPLDTWPKSVRLRTTATDPSGRTWIHYSNAITVALGSGADGTETGADEGEEGGESTGSGGCRGCSANGRTPSPNVVLLLCAWGLRRRRRSRMLPRPERR